MIDNDMTNILKNFSNANDGTGKVTDAKTGKTKVSTAASEKNAMKALLEGLDLAQKSVNQMPGTHPMAKNDTKHPASKFLVGGEEDNDGYILGDTEVGKIVTNNDGGFKLKVLNVNHLGTYKLKDLEDGSIHSVPEEEFRDNYSFEVSEEREPELTNTPTIQPGMQVHVGHHLPGGSGIEGEVVRIEDDMVIIQNPEGKKYKGQLKNTTVLEAAVEEDTISKRKPSADVHKKQSLADIFRSMDETEEDMACRFKKELHDEKTKKAVSKGDNGKFNLAEEEDTGWGDEMIEDLRLLYIANKSSLDYNLLDGLQEIIERWSADTSVNEGDIISSSADSKIDQHVNKLGEELYWEAVTLAKEVYDEEGPGQGQTRSRTEYIKYAVDRFLTKEYLRSIMGNIIEAYNNNKE